MTASNERPAGKPHLGEEYEPSRPGIGTAAVVAAIIVGMLAYSLFH